MPQGTPASSQIITLTRMLEEREETMYAQAAVIEALRKCLMEIRGLSYATTWETINEALSIPTDSTQILDEVRRAERERVAKMFEESGIGGDHLAAAIRAME